MSLHPLKLRKSFILENASAMRWNHWHDLNVAKKNLKQFPVSGFFMTLRVFIHLSASEMAIQ